MNRFSAPSRSVTSSARARLPRWQRWLHRIAAPVLLAGMVLPALPDAQALAAGNDGAGEVGGTALNQQQPPPQQVTPPSDKSFEDLSPEDLFGQPIYEVVKAEWDKDFQPTQGIEIRIPAVNYAAADVPALPNGKDGLQKVDNFQGRPGPTLLWANDDRWVEGQGGIP